MPIGKPKSDADKVWSELNPPRVYSDAELKDFFQKIKRFYKKKTLSTGEEVEILDQNEFAVAYGAFVKKPGPENTVYYMIAGEKGEERYVQMFRLLDQFDDWRRKQDWIAGKQEEQFLSTGALAKFGV